MNTITLMDRKTCRNCNVPSDYIADMEELQEETNDRVYPYTRIHIVDPKQNHDYTIDVVESKKYILKAISEHN